jgi:hypothetical protein
MKVEFKFLTIKLNCFSFQERDQSLFRLIHSQNITNAKHIMIFKVLD